MIICGFLQICTELEKTRQINEQLNKTTTNIQTNGIVFVAVI